MKNIGPGENAQRIIDALGCECKYFPPARDDGALMKAYSSALERGKREGFTPVIIICDDTLTEWLTEIVCEDKPLRQLRAELLSQPSEGGKELFDELRQSRLEDNECDDISEEELIGEFGGGEPMLSFSGYTSYRDGSVEEVILAEIPTAKPYEVFAWVPFGGWNECPEPADMIKAARYWYEKHGAIPAVIGHDTLELTAKPLDRDTAMAVAMEQYALCPDIVDQGVGTVGALAHSLSQSAVWFFWWD